MAEVILLLLFGGGVLFFSKSAQAALPGLKTFIRIPSLAEIDLTDVDALARTIWGEARGEGQRGMQAVANVVMNRFQLAQEKVAKGQQFGFTVAEIVKKPFQFSVWNVNDSNYAKLFSVTTADAQFLEALQIADAALRGELLDITNGADHYHTAAVNPSWSRGENPVSIINSHKFFKLA